MTLGYYVKATSAVRSLDSLLQFAERVFPEEVVAFSLSTNVGQSLSVRCPGAAIRKAPEIERLREIVVERPAILLVSASCAIPQQTRGISYTTKDGLVGQVTFVGTDEGFLKLALDALDSSFTPVSYHDELAKISSAVDVSALRSREVAADELKAQVEKLASFLSELAIKDSERRKALLAEQDQWMREKQHQLDEDFRKRQAESDAEISRREQELREKIATHEETVKKFKTIEAKLMRRELLERIDKVIWSMKEFAVSEGTEKKRGPIKWMVVVIMVVAFLLVLALVGLMFFDQSRIPYLIAPTSGSFAAFMGTAIYYLKWNDRWFREHADSEFSAKRYQADILRASWVAELVSEWQAEAAGGRPPAELIEAFTRHLFEVSGSRDTDHPLEALAGMVKRVSSVTVGKGTISVQGSPTADPGERLPIARERRANKGQKAQAAADEV